MNLERLLRDETDLGRYDAGAVIFDTDEPGDVMYAVREGAVDLVVAGDVLETVGAGGIFGEMALLDRTHRSATAIARERTVVVRLSRDRFEALIRHEPRFALHVMGVLAERLRRATERD